MTRIDPRLVPDEFISQGLTPVQGWFGLVFHERLCCCLLGEKGAAKAGFHSVANMGIMNFSEVLGLDEYYAHGLSDGWESTLTWYFEDSLAYRLGLRDGMVARKEVKAYGLFGGRHVFEEYDEKIRDLIMQDDEDEPEDPIEDPPIDDEDDYDPDNADEEVETWQSPSIPDEELEPVACGT